MIKSLIYCFCIKKYSKIYNDDTLIIDNSSSTDDYLIYVSDRLLEKIDMILDYIYNYRYTICTLYNKYIEDIYLYIKNYNSILFNKVGNNKIELNEYLKNKWNINKENYIYTYLLIQCEVDKKKNSIRYYNNKNKSFDKDLNSIYEIKIEILKSNLLKYKDLLDIFNL